jgi:hypothetical protein
MNESFQRITTWAKAHPALSVGIVAVPVIVGYMVYKKVGVSGGLSATGAEGDTSGLTTGGGGGSALEDLLGGGSGTPDPSYFIGGSVPEAMSFAIPTSAYAMTPTAFAVTPAISGDHKLPKLGDVISGTVPASVSKIATPQQSVSILGVRIPASVTAPISQATILQNQVLGVRLPTPTPVSTPKTVLGVRLPIPTPVSTPKTVLGVRLPTPTPINYNPQTVRSGA